MIQRESYGFNTFAANRIGEIHQTTEKEEWLWVAGKPWLNVADLATRGASLTELGKSLWQSGPQFLTQSEKKVEKGRFGLPQPCNYYWLVCYCWFVTTT